MKLLKNEKTENYHEIEVEYSFLWFGKKVKYRKVGGTVFKFKSPNNYYNIGLIEHIDVRDLFMIPV